MSIEKKENFNDNGMKEMLFQFKKDIQIEIKISIFEERLKELVKLEGQEELLFIRKGDESLEEIDLIISNIIKVLESNNITIFEDTISIGGKIYDFPKRRFCLIIREGKADGEIIINFLPRFLGFGGLEYNIDINGNVKIDYYAIPPSTKINGTTFSIRSENKSVVAQKLIENNILITSEGISIGKKMFEEIINIPENVNTMNIEVKNGEIIFAFSGDKREDVLLKFNLNTGEIITEEMILESKKLEFQNQIINELSSIGKKYGDSFSIASILQKINQEGEEKEFYKKELHKAIKLSEILTQKIDEEIYDFFKFVYENNISLKKIYEYKRFKEILSKKELLPYEYAKGIDSLIANIIKNVDRVKQLSNFSDRRVLKIFFPTINFKGKVEIVYSSISIDFFIEDEEDFKQIWKEEEVGGYKTIKRKSYITVYRGKKSGKNSSILHEKRHVKNGMMNEEHNSDSTTYAGFLMEFLYGEEFINKAKSVLESNYNSSLLMVVDEISAYLTNEDISADNIKEILYYNTNKKSYQYTRYIENDLLQIAKKKNSTSTFLGIKLHNIDYEKEINIMIEKGHKQYNEIIGKIVDYLYGINGINTGVILERNMYLHGILDLKVEI